jgi:hypothetical protein
LKVYFVCERNPRSAPAAIAKIACDPHGVYASVDRGFQKTNEVAPADAGGVCSIMKLAVISIWIEHRR